MNDSNLEKRQEVGSMTGLWLWQLAPFLLVVTVNKYLPALKVFNKQLRVTHSINGPFNNK